MNYRINHRTEYVYSDNVTLGHNEARLTPRSTARQACSSTQLIIDPPADICREREDFFGNRVAYFAIQKPHKHLRVTATSDVCVESGPIPDLSIGTWERECELLQDRRDLNTVGPRHFVLDSPMAAAAPEVREFAQVSFPTGRPLLEATCDLMQRIYQEFTYVPGATTISTPTAAVLRDRKGVCQDFAHLGIASLRSLGLPARYVSGYLETRPPQGQKRLKGADASHAWFSVYSSATGWIDFDPTNNQIPGDRHITVAWGRDFGDATPLKGILFGSGRHRLSVAVDVENLST